MVYIISTACKGFSFKGLCQRESNLDGQINNIWEKFLSFFYNIVHFAWFIV